MSSLIKSLTQIQNWLQKHNSLSYRLLNPGLSDIEITNICQKFLIKLPIELYELYKWRNGCGDGSRTWEFAGIFDQWSFVPLQYAVAEYRPSLEENDSLSSNFHNPNSLNIFFSNEIYDEGYVLLDKNQEVSLVEFGDWVDGSWNYLIHYTNLTNMMLTIAESYETAYYVNKKGLLIPDNQKINRIWYKYNFSKIADSVLEQLQQPLSLESFGKIAANLVKFKTPRSPTISIHERPIPNQQLKDIISVTFFIKEAVRILGELGDARAVPSLISILDIESDFWCIKDWQVSYSLATSIQETKVEAQQMKAWTLKEIRELSAWALGEIGDLRAAVPLIKALQDSGCKVRIAAREALIKLALKFPEIENIVPF